MWYDNFQKPWSTKFTFGLQGIQIKLVYKGHRVKVKVTEAINAKCSPTNARLKWEHDCNCCNSKPISVIEAGMGTRRKSSRPRRDRDAHPRDRDVGFTSRDETLKFPDETKTRRLYLSRRDRDVKVQVLLIAITGLDVIFHVHCL